jgi:hypothetical protein
MSSEKVGEGDLHVHEMCLAILEIALGQSNADWQNRIIFDAISPAPKSRNRGSLFMNRVGRRGRDSLTES